MFTLTEKIPFNWRFSVRWNFLAINYLLNLLYYYVDHFDSRLEKVRGYIVCIICTSVWVPCDHRYSFPMTFRANAVANGAKHTERRWLHRLIYSAYSYDLKITFLVKFNSIQIKISSFYKTLLLVVSVRNPRARRGSLWWKDRGRKKNI